MLDLLFLLLLRMRRMPLILFTVTCGSLMYSVFGYKYYLVVVDDFSHYSWTFSLRAKSETFPTLLHFFAWVSTQFGLTIKTVQCDNGREFDNSTSPFFLPLSRCSAAYVLSIYLSPERQG